MRNQYKPRPEFGPIMNAYAWLEKRSFSLEGLFEKLKAEKSDSTAVIVKKERGTQYIAALTAGNFEDTVKFYEPMIDGKSKSWYIDTGNGYRYPSDRILLVDVVGVNAEGKLTSLRGSPLDLKVTPYVFK